MLRLPPLSLYIHFPWCVHKCPYCDFNSHVLKKAVPEQEYIKRLLRELDETWCDQQGRKFHSIYLGGGTPSLFSGDAIAYLMEQLRMRRLLPTDIEISMEANPESITLQNLSLYQKSGINRISVGVQSFNDTYLKKLGRAHNSHKAQQALDLIKTQGFDKFNIDVMYGLPGQSIQEGIHDLETAFAWMPPHLSWYQLTIEPNTAFFKRPPTLPTDDTIIGLYEAGAKCLQANGFEGYEISAWSCTEQRCHHNANYWLFGDYLGIGAGAHSKITYLDSQAITRHQNYNNPTRYMASSSSRAQSNLIQKSELPFEFMLNALRLYQPVSSELFESRTGLSWGVLAPALEKAVEKNLVTLKQNGLCVTEQGKRFYNDLVSLFL